MHVSYVCVRLTASDAGFRICNRWWWAAPSCSRMRSGRSRGCAPSWRDTRYVVVVVYEDTTRPAQSTVFFTNPEHSTSHQINIRARHISSSWWTAGPNSPSRSQTRFAPTPPALWRAYMPSGCVCVALIERENTSLCMGSVSCHMTHVCWCKHHTYIPLTKIATDRDRHPNRRPRRRRRGHPGADGGAGC